MAGWLVDLMFLRILTDASEGGSRKTSRNHRNDLLMRVDARTTSGPTVSYSIKEKARFLMFLLISVSSLCSNRTTPPYTL
jgi:hypothetical protein